MPHTNMPHHGPTPMQLAYAVPSELPPTHSNAAIGPFPNDLAMTHSIPSLGQAQGFWHAQPQMQLQPQFGNMGMDRRFSAPGPCYVGSDGSSLASASQQSSSEEQESEESSEGQESKTGSSEGGALIREVLVYVDRPVYVDRLVHVPVYVRQPDVKVKTVSCGRRPPTHDFPYHDPLPEVGCRFVCNGLPATTDITAY